MLLAIDIGNTSIKFGLFEGEDLVSKFLIGTDRELDPDDLDASLGHKLGQRITAAIVSSVVPQLDNSFRRFISEKAGVEPYFIRPSDDYGLTFDYAIDEAGTDRLVNSFAASTTYGVPCIVISFGTATTVDVTAGDHRHLGGLIAPGPGATAKAMQIVASKLPEVEIAEPPNVISTTTVTAIQSGILYSQIGLVEASVRHIRSEIGNDAVVVATGGYAPLVASRCPSIDHIEPDLTLIGLRMLYSRQQAACLHSDDDGN